MAEFIHKGKALLPMSVIRAAIEGDCEAIERVLRHYDDYMNRLCTRTLYDKKGVPYVGVDSYTKRCMEIRLIQAIVCDCPQFT